MRRVRATMSSAEALRISSGSGSSWGCWGCESVMVASSVVEDEDAAWSGWGLGGVAGCCGG